MGQWEARRLLRGVVQMDDAYPGEEGHGKVGRGTTRPKAVVAVSVGARGAPAPEDRAGARLHPPDGQGGRCPVRRAGGQARLGRPERIRRPGPGWLSARGGAHQPRPEPPSLPGDRQAPPHLPDIPVPGPTRCCCSSSAARPPDAPLQAKARSGGYPLSLHGARVVEIRQLLPWRDSPVKGRMDRLAGVGWSCLEAHPDCERGRSSQAAPTDPDRGMR
jgi:hypothetical protein